ncbi:MAG: TonB-dependent receptor [bacterium]|nr:TonB-dependent receptor [bacterium]
MARTLRLMAVALLLFSLCDLLPYAARADVAGVVQGTFTTKDGAPIAGADVTLTGNGHVQSTSTDARGAFTFLRVEFGDYELHAVKAGAGEAKAHVSVNSGSRISVHLEAGALTIIAVRAASGGTVSGTPVAVNGVGQQQIATLPSGSSLNKVVETLPGIVSFSYNEPVAHGFHGVTYALDGLPLPLPTSANFSEIVDPRDVDSLEVFTGAIPAEFGGQRIGAVVNLNTKHANDLQYGNHGTLATSIGSNASAGATFTDSLHQGNTAAYLALDTNRTSRGIDAPTVDAIHDASNASSQFLRAIQTLGKRDTLSLDALNAYSAFQVPINTTRTSTDPIVNPAGTDDNQQEYSRFLSLAWNHTSRDGMSYIQIAPWSRYGRVRYNPDPAKDLASYIVNPDGSTTPLQSTYQDRAASYVGLSSSWFRQTKHHGIKAGVDVARENFASTFVVNQLDPTTGKPLPPFTDNPRQTGSSVGIYLEDRYNPSPALAINAGLRYDASTGFVGGNQLSPRIELNLKADEKNVLHVFYGRFYSAPSLEDTRREAVIAFNGTPPATEPVYDLVPERDSYWELGLAHTFGPGLSGYVNVFDRTAVNVLDTTQLNNTPIFALFNSSLGVAQGVELRLKAQLANGDFWNLSGTLSSSQVEGLSGGLFNFPAGTVAGATSFQPEDHDQTVAANFDYTHVMGAAKASYVSLAGDFGTGFPVAFESGVARLPSHFTMGLAVGRRAGVVTPSSMGWKLSLLNLFNDPYIIKQQNGFNTTQYAAGRSIEFAVSLPF